MDRVYCISLRSRPDRYGAAVAELHRVGLCRHTLFLRPEKGPRGGVVRSIWESHRTCLRHARSEGAGTALMLEDDVQFRPWLQPRHVARAGAELRRLAADWHAFYLGHLPLGGYLVRPRVLRTMSAQTHAYVASRRLMDWLDATNWQPNVTPSSRILGYGLDSAYSQLPGMYALIPMLAVQSDSPSDHLGSHKSKKLAGVFDLAPMVQWLATTAPLPMQYITAVLSPVWWLIGRRVLGLGRGGKSGARS